MTTIAYRDGKMSADSRAYAGDASHVGSKAKIHVMSDGSILGVSSTVVGMPEAFAKWLDNPNRDAASGIPGLSKLSFNAIHVLQNGEVYYYASELYPSGPISGEYLATGSGGEYAVAAMSMGATAKEAIKVAIKFDVWSEYPINSMSLKKAKKL